MVFAPGKVLLQLVDIENVLRRFLASDVLSVQLRFIGHKARVDILAVGTGRKFAEHFLHLGIKLTGCHFREKSVALARDKLGEQFLGIVFSQWLSIICRGPVRSVEMRFVDAVHLRVVVHYPQHHGGAAARVAHHENMSDACVHAFSFFTPHHWRKSMSINLESLSTSCA
jgi:hypothetical protein